MAVMLPCETLSIVHMLLLYTCYCCIHATVVSMQNQPLYTHTGLAALVTVFGFVFGHFAPYPFLRVAIVMTVRGVFVCMYNYMRIQPHMRIVFSSQTTCT